MENELPQNGTLVVRLVQNQDELVLAQRLRYKMFYEEPGIIAPYQVARSGLDFDRFDHHCDHLVALFTDHATGQTSVVGNYRLLRGRVAKRHGGFRSEEEFDLSPLEHYPGEVMELGRACVHPDFRNGGVIQRLWAGIAHYVTDHRVDLMFGMASFPGIDVSAMRHALSYLHHYKRASEVWAPRAVTARYVDMKMVKEKHLDKVRALREMPPLVKGYMRLGGLFGDGAVIDPALHSVDTCVVVETGKIKGRYQRKYIPATPPMTTEEPRKLI